MRLGVLDVGSTTVHLLVVDASPGATPVPTASHKRVLRLAERLDADGALQEEGVADLLDAVASARAVATAEGVEELSGFATSALREATRGADVLERVRAETGVALEVLSGGAEARLTFFAVRRWFGWSAGRMLVLDIGGGSLEMAVGRDEDADVALSVPLGAGRTTRSHLAGGVTRPRDVAGLREHARAVLAASTARLHEGGPPDLAVGSSKTFRTLGRLTGAAPAREGMHVPRELTREALEELVPRLASLGPAGRRRLAGVSQARAGQVVAGSVVALEAMRALDVERLSLSPWALREGVILRRLDALAPLLGR
ncbi:Ppx/GppA phosphatase family protein [Pseudokineococcus sp. 1T1Z-3]|uniref:Ppx/GppA phosphatase family protein n=1 Tax=Pseudokineococcus sp. 1T1Z-3 TaxID=3132745 RepID=UPI00309E9470